MTTANLRFVVVGKYRNVGPFLVSYSDDTELSQAIIRAAIKHGSVPDQVLSVRLQKWAEGQLPTFVLTDGNRERLGWGTLERVTLA